MQHNVTRISIGSGTVPVGSDEWWVQRLSQEIRDRNAGKGWNHGRVSNPDGARPGLLLLQKWLRNEPPPPPGSDETYISAWSNFLRLSRTNYAELVTSSRTERIVAQGWRTAVETGADTDGDQEAESLAIHTNLRTRVAEAVQDMCSLGEGYLLVGPDWQEDGKALITSESPTTTIVARDRADRPRAGLRLLRDDWTGNFEAWLYMPPTAESQGYMRVARKSSHQGWAWAGDPEPIPDFPLVPMVNHLGIGEFERHLDALARINDTVFTRLVLTKLQAHRQRALEQPTPKVGELDIDIDVDVDDFVSGPDALWLLPPGAKLWESGSADFSSIRLMSEDDVKALAAVTKTPIWQLLPGSQNQSATGSDRAHEGFLALVEDRRHRVEVALAKALGMAFSIMGDETRSDASKIRTIWGPTERYSLSEKAQAFASMYGKWPFEELAVDVMQKRPSDLARLSNERMKDSFLTNAVAGSGT